jgi:hypothetical protein
MANKSSRSLKISEIEKEELDGTIPVWHTEAEEIEPPPANSRLNGKSRPV